MVCSAFVNTLGAEFKVPYLTLPFNLIVICTFLTIQHQEDNQENTTENTFNSTVSELPINWYQVGRGIAVSMGQVYAINDVIASSIMNLAVFLASPLLFVMSTIGAILGSLAGAQCLKIIEKVSFNIASEVDKSSLKMPKMVQLGDFMIT